jgi:hypothetical protein
MSGATMSQAESEGTVKTRPAARPKGPRRWSMSVVNFALDALLLVMLETLGAVAAILRFAFPVPTDADGWTLWGLSFNQWFDIQFCLLCALAMGVVLHVMLHWNWVCSVLSAQILNVREKIDEGMQTIYGVATLIVLLHILLIGLIAAVWGIHKPPH